MPFVGGEDGAKIRQVRGDQDVGHGCAHELSEHALVQVERLVFHVSQRVPVVVAHAQAKARRALQWIVEKAAQSPQRDLQGRGLVVVVVVVVVGTGRAGNGGRRRHDGRKRAARLAAATQLLRPMLRLGRRQQRTPVVAIVVASKRGPIFAKQALDVVGGKHALPQQRTQLQQHRRAG